MFVLILLFATSVARDLTIEYYKNLIDQSITNATKYKLPTDNSEFEDGLKSNTLHDLGSFDFIIIGAGSAGCVLATRLSEISEWRVLLLEAGDKENDFNNIPAMLYYCQFNDLNWGYYTTPQKNCCLGMKDQKCMAPRGKVLGGSSAINALAYTRGNKNDYEHWAALGNPGWSYADVLPYFIKSENSQIDGDADYHGTGGFWNVEYSPPLSDIVKYFKDANAELRRPYVDFDGQSQFGFSKTHQNVRQGQRQSTGTAFLDNARKRKKLKIITKALVTRIIIHPKLKTAQSVEFVTKNQKFQGTASKEVILSAGAINSPQILMLSGVGPKKQLQKLKIDVIENLAAVGENLHDHPLFQGLNFRTNYTKPQHSLDEDIEAFLKGNGALTTAAGNQAMGFLASKNVPQVEYILSPPLNINSKISNRVSNFNDKISENFILNPDTDISLLAVLLHPKSKGRVSLKSSDPLDFPKIDLNMFSEPEDIDTFINGIEQILQLLETKAFQKINATFLNFNICTQYEIFSKNYWDCAIRHLSGTIYHPCGTTAMGPNSTASVVDTNLKVYGIKNLRVVDAGVIPSTISGHPNAPVVMIAEKISDSIKTDYGKPIIKCKIDKNV